MAWLDSHLIINASGHVLSNTARHTKLTIVRVRDRVKSQHQHHFKLVKIEYFSIRKILVGGTRAVKNNDNSKVEGNIHFIKIYLM